MAAMFLSPAWIHAQPSASGCGIISEADAAEAPSLPVQSAFSVRTRPAPLGIVELSSLRMTLGMTPYQVGGWIDGRGGSEWTDVTIGVHMRWPIDSAFAIGIAPRLRSQWFRAFPPHHIAAWDVQATATYGAITAGIALRDLPLSNAVPRPFLHVSTMFDLSDLRVALDLGMNAASEMWVGITADAAVSGGIRIAGLIRTQPFAVHAGARVAIDHTHAVVTTVIYRQALGIIPELAWIWSFDA